VSQSEITLRKATGIESFLVGDELLLYSATAQTMYRLNGSAAFIWDCIEDGLSYTSIRDQLAEVFSIERRRADDDLSAVTRQWQSLGLLDAAAAGSGRAVNDEATLSEAPHDPPEPGLRCSSFDSSALVHERYYQLLDVVLRIRFPDVAMRDLVDAVLMRDGLVAKRDCDVAIDLWRDGRGYYLIEGEDVAARCGTPEELPPLLLAHAASAAYMNSQRLVGLHAAAISKDNHCVVFPAISGSGKSTLTAALVASGYDYCTDELVVIARDSPRVRTAPVALSTKSGSWQVLRKYYRDIDALPIYRRADGRAVRYLLPQGAQATAFDPGGLVRAVVFPRYTPGQAANLSDISAGDALCRLTEAGYDVEGGLDRQSVGALIEWIGRHPCYEFQFDDLDDAIAAIAGLLP
jgi:hypothetical protein